MCIVYIYIFTYNIFFNYNRLKKTFETNKLKTKIAILL